MVCERAIYGVSMPRPTRAHISSNAQDWAEDFALLGNPVRLQVLLELARNGPQNVKSLAKAVNLPQSEISYHLKGLRLRGFVTSKRLGREVVYRADPLVLKGLEVALRRLRPNR